MFLQCDCGYTLTDVACPGRIVHHLVSAHGIEFLQDAADKEVKENGQIDCWYEHWRTARVTEAWLCPKCYRLYIGATNDRPVWVYRLERTGIDPSATGLDSDRFSPVEEVLALVPEQSGESPLMAPPPRE